MPQQEPMIDLAELDAPSEDDLALPAEFDTDADYAAPAPPLPDGWHQAQLSIVGVKDASGTLVGYIKRPWGNIPNTFHTSIQARIIDPDGPQDNKYATDNTVTTAMDKKKKTSKVFSYYRGVTGKACPGVNEEDNMKAFIKALLSKPTVWVKTQLEGQAADAGKAFSDAKKAQKTNKPVDADGHEMKAPKTFRGQLAFTQEGKLTGRVYDPETKEFVVGRAQILDIKLDRPDGAK